MGSKGTNTTTSSFKPPAEFMKAYKEALGMAREATSQPYQQYKGNLVAGLTPTQQRGIANVNAAQGMALPAIQQGMQYTTQAAQGVTPELYQRFYSPYVKDVANTTFANLMESQAQQQSNLKGGAIQAGAFGGDRGGIAQSEMARQQQLANSMAMSNIYNQGYGQAMGLAGQQVANLGAMGQQMAGLGAGAQASVLQGAQAQMAAGAQQQATEQARLQAAYDQWMQRQAYPYQQAQFFANIAQGLGAGAGGTSSTTAPAPNMMSQILGGLGAVGSIFSGSDARMKENIEAVGKLNDGQTIYRYNFKGDPKTQIGLLAQEVEHHKPGAVAQVKGLKMVNYKDATEDAASMGGVVGPNGGRQAFAEGGVPYYPYGDARAYVPEGKIAGRSATIPEAPKPYDDEGLAKDWKEMMPLTKEQVGGLRNLAAKAGIDLPDKADIVGIFGGDSQGLYNSGGVVGRHGYADGGDPEIPPGLITSESGGDFGAKNAQGYVGRLQFGEDRLTDAKRAGVIPADMTPEDFRRSPEAQKATEAWHFGDINNFIDKTGLAAAEGKSIKGIPVTRAGLVSVAHLGGKGGLEKFVASGGRYDPADANGTRLSDYLAMASDKSGVGGLDTVPVSDTSGGVAPSEAVDQPEFVIPGEKPGLGGLIPKFDAGKIFANEENPSVIERIMGRRLSPEARSAVMNASFALMAGRSPFFFSNLGEAGKVGTQTYYNALQQGRELARNQAEIEKTAAETAKSRSDVMRNWVERWRSYNFTNIGSGKEPIEFNDYLKMVGVDPRMFSSSSTQTFSTSSAPTEPPAIGSDGQPATEPVVQSGSEAMPPPSGTEEISTQPESKKKAQAPQQSKYTLDYWQNELNIANKLIAAAGDNEGLLAPALARQKNAQDRIDKIQESPEYKDQQAIVTSYGEKRANLERLAQIYKNYHGGFGSEAIRDLTAIADQLGIELPPDIASNAASFDEAYKLTVERGINDAGSNGLLKAPAAALVAESKTQPTPEMMPLARYNLIVKSIANLDRYKDLYENWDTGPNFNKYAAEWLKANPLKNYVDKVKEEIPPFEGMPTDENAMLPSMQEMLNTKFPNAADGTVVSSKSGKKAQKVNGKWVEVQ